MVKREQEEIYAAYRDKVLSYLSRRTDSPEDAEDLCADVFEKVIRALPDYRGDRRFLSTWIYTITRNTLADHYRTRHTGEALAEDMAANEDMEASLIKQETLSRLGGLLSAMDKKERDVIVLHYYKGYTLRRVAQLTGISYGMVKVTHKKALQTLRRYLT